MSIAKKIISYLVFIFALLLIVGLIKDSWRLMHADERIKETKEKLARLKEENKQLLEKLDYYQSNEFLEEQIRNKLQMAKPGETILILPEEINGKRLEEALTSSGQLVDSVVKEELANWQKWLRLFW